VAVAAAGAGYGDAVTEEKRAKAEKRRVDVDVLEENMFAVDVVVRMRFVVRVEGED
jgi:hypothetical protein